MILAYMTTFVLKTLTVVLAVLAAGAAGYWVYQNPESVKAAGHVFTRSVLWIVVVAALPWSSFLFMRPLLDLQSKLQSARAAAAVSLGVIVAFWIVDLLFAGYLAGWSFSGTLTWIVVLLGFAAAAAYNFVICESLARHVAA